MNIHSFPRNSIIYSMDSDFRDRMGIHILYYIYQYPYYPIYSYIVLHIISSMDSDFHDLHRSGLCPARERKWELDGQKDELNPVNKLIVWIVKVKIHIRWFSDHPETWILSVFRLVLSKPWNSTALQAPAPPPPPPAAASSASSSQIRISTQR